MMRRKAFILAEILTGMMIQAWFIVTLCGAFYLLLTFSNRIQQGNAAQDHGQRVIAYIDARIRNAGLGLWDCGEAENLAESYLPKLLRLKNLHLPVAITSRDINDFNPYAVPADGIYSGDVLTLLYAHAEYDSDIRGRILVATENNQSQDVVGTSTYYYNLIFSTTEGKKVFAQSQFVKKASSSPYDIHNYGVTESSGAPLILLSTEKNSQKTIQATPTKDTTIYPMSELLELECERMYVAESTGIRSFMIKELGKEKDRNNSIWKPASPHTAGVLEIFMTLDTNQKPPVFDLKVLVSEGKSDTPSQKPSNWPRRYWKTDYQKYKVHVSQASWRLYNLVPFYN